MSFLATRLQDEGLEKWPDAASAANIGIMLFRATKAQELAKVEGRGRLRLLAICGAGKPCNRCLPLRLPTIEGVGGPARKG